MPRITKRQLAMLRSLDTRKGRDETGLFLVEGVRLCAEMAGAGLPAELVLVAEEARDKPEVAALAARLAAAGAEVVEAPLSDVERVSDTVQSQGFLAAARRRETPPQDLRYGERAVVVALDGVADPGNAGTVIRTAAWFGAAAVLLGHGGVDPLNPKVVRATMGGLFHLPVCGDVDLPAALAALRGEGFRIVAAAMDGAPDWRGWRATPRCALLLGSEARGIDPALLALADRRVTVPRHGAGDSLNVAVTAGILLADA
jgi:TrmH family RNA methyltransferase